MQEIERERRMKKWGEGEKNVRILKNCALIKFEVIYIRDGIDWQALPW